jgi:hypothetical protein
MEKTFFRPGMSHDKPIKIALVTYWFPPNTTVAARRGLHLYRHLNRYPGLRLDVFTGSFNREDPFQGRLPVSPGRVSYIKLYRNAFEKNIFAEKNAFFHLLNRTCYLGKAERRLGNSLRRPGFLRDYDIIYLSMGPFSAFLKTAAALKKLYPEKKVVVEYRDEWVEGAIDYAVRNHLIHPYHPGRSIYRKMTHLLVRPAAARLERKVLPACDAIFVISRGMIEHFTRRIPELSPASFKHIPNGISDSEIAALNKWRRERRPAAGKTLRIMYAGMLFGTQDIRPFLNALRELIGEGRVAPAEIEFNPDGSCDSPYPNANLPWSEDSGNPTREKNYIIMEEETTMKKALIYVYPTTGIIKERIY